MDTTPRQNGMDDRQKAVEAALTKWGFESLWANGKGGGFWVKGKGYMSLEDCARLINECIRDFIKSEKDRLGELMLKAMAEAQAAQNSNYFEKAMAVYTDANSQLGKLGSLTFPTFYLPPVKWNPAPTAGASQTQSTFRPLPPVNTEPAQFESSEIIGLRQRLVTVRQLISQAGDRRDEDALDRLEAEESELEQEIAAIMRQEGIPDDREE